MLKEERFDHILTVLRDSGKVGYAPLSADLSVSEDTIRRDIDILSDRGLLVKVRGGAILPAKNPLNFQDRSSYFTTEKEIIALKTQPFIKSGQTIFMDGGTTICEIAAHLPVHSNFRVITNNQALVPVLSMYKGVEIIVLGGTYNRETQTNTGLLTCQDVGSYVADLYLMGACAIQYQYGITVATKEEGDVKQAMLKSSLQQIVVSHTDKLNSTYPFKVCDVSEVGMLITDVASDDKRLDDFRGSGIQLV
ncbi:MULTISPECIES: DeoR/GlpR family DNA-binding transcription regulator [unclassified Sphingobacterium]|uniref:DeoR/GlpR family DNA-binding transcription regulator n=1 Tax=unclassified Sphingobacterium TaxID=2609468 RepID=UPI0025DCC9D4|nr:MULTISPECIES: DeoR/GlpR family DNA-binding transcription regulator [unclassified Sphingobacterium]